MAVGMSCIVLSVGFGLITPLVVGQAIDALQREFTRNALLRYSFLLLGITLVQGVFSFLQRKILVSMSRDIEFELRNSYFGHLEGLPLSFFQNHHTGDLMARGTNDLQAVRMLCGPAIMYSTNTLITAAGALYFMSRINLGLTLLALCTLPLVAVVTKVFGQRIHHLFERVQEQFATISAHVQEHLAGVRVIRAYAQEGATRDRFECLNTEYVDRNRALIRWTAAFQPLLHGLIGIGFVAVLWRGGSLVSAGTITVGQFVTFTFFLGKLVWPMIAIGWVINLAQRGAASMGRILAVLETEPAIADVRGCLTRPDRGEIEFRDLEFSYVHDAPVLEGIRLQVPAGSSVAIVGRTGSGKSTLLSMIPRLWDPPDDTVFIDQLDVRKYSLRELRSVVGAVPQETFLFSDTLQANIAFGRHKATTEEVLRAASLAGLDSDLESLPKGLDTLVGERGVTLSGGQKQRVALARALLRNPRILLLDDCLSAVDTNTEERILANLQVASRGRTLFLVSHRISTVKNADQIVVLDCGKIVQQGRHSDLLQEEGLYLDLHRRQLLEDELAAV
jgi:ATP-binding cassette subfamily B protein